MRASKLITLSAAAVLAGGANLALGQTSSQSGSAREGSSVSVQKKPLGARVGSQKMAWETRKPHAQRSQGIGPSARSGVYARANARELGEAGIGPGTQERSRLREAVRAIPRLSNLRGTDIRIDAVVPRSVRQAAAPLPPAVQRLHPRLRHDRVFLYRDQVVIVNPITSRIVAIIKA
jgi:hypothetical protein